MNRCINVVELLLDRVEDTNAMMNMKVMEVKDLRNSFMQTAEAIARKGMEQEDNMNKRATIGRRKDMTQGDKGLQAYGG